MPNNFLRLGEFSLAPLSDGRFWLDGGAMFGVVPKVLWNKLNPADELNRIELALNCLLVQTRDYNIIIDTGIGEKVDDKFQNMYRFTRERTLIELLGNIGLTADKIHFVINTHLHFDHCGGDTLKKQGNFVPTFSKAKYIIQSFEWEDAVNPSERTKASYFNINFLPVKDAGQLLLVDGDYEVCPGVRVIRTNGHTRGHQSVLIESAGEKAIYFGDLIPTASHIKIPYIMGYDLFPLDIIEKKKDILTQAVRENWLLVFEHDPKVIFARLAEEGGKKVLKPIDFGNTKFQNPSSKQIPINQTPNSKPYDLAERTLKFTKEVIEFIRTLPKTPANTENSKQLIRSSGSVGSNYIEANESLGKKDFLMRIRICKKEAKESAYWLKLVECNDQKSENRRNTLIDEAMQFVKIFNSIAEKSK